MGLTQASPNSFRSQPRHSVLLRRLSLAQPRNSNRRRSHFSSPSSSDCTWGTASDPSCFLSQTWIGLFRGLGRRWGCSNAGVRALHHEPDRSELRLRSCSRRPRCGRDCRHLVGTTRVSSRSHSRGDLLRSRSDLLREPARTVGGIQIQELERSRHGASMVVADTSRLRGISERLSMVAVLNGRSITRSRRNSRFLLATRSYLAAY